MFHEPTDFCPTDFGPNYEQIRAHHLRGADCAARRGPLLLHEVETVRYGLDGHEFPENASLQEARGGRRSGGRDGRR